MTTDRRPRDTVTSIYSVPSLLTPQLSYGGLEYRIKFHDSWAEM